MPNGIQPSHRGHTALPGEYPGSTRPEIGAPRRFYAVDSESFKPKQPTTTEIPLILVSTRRLMNADASLILPTPEPGRF